MTGLDLQDSSQNAGGSWNIERAYLYCLELNSTTSLAGKTLRMTVSFIDEDGIRGTIDSSTTVSE